MGCAEPLDGVVGVAPWDVLEAWMLAFKQGSAVRTTLCQADLYSCAQVTVGL